MAPKVALRRGRATALAGVLVLPAVLAGCSSVPDALNPAEWWRDTVDFFSGDEDTAESPTPAEGVGAARDTPAPGADQDFPKLSSVPDRSQARRVPEGTGLVADSGRRYSDEAIARQGAAVNALEDSQRTATAMAKAEPPAPPKGMEPKMAAAASTAPSVAAAETAVRAAPTPPPMPSVAPSQARSPGAMTTPPPRKPTTMAAAPQASMAASTP
ncbi:MAG: hypothetical protein KDE22_06280, partial [Rhodobacterales bacterium]|nr:hypothetical protein [Rhodobacterales bacterium]